MNCCKTDRVLSDVKVGVWVYNPNEDILHWDNTMFKIFGKKETGKVLNYSFFLNSLHKEDLERVNNLVETAVKEKSYYNTVYKIIRDDLSIGFIRAYGTLMEDKINIAGICIPITESEYMSGVLEPSQEIKESFFYHRKSLLFESLSNLGGKYEKVPITNKVGEWVELKTNIWYRNVCCDKKDNLTIEYVTEAGTCFKANDNHDCHLLNIDDGNIEVLIRGEEYLLSRGRGLFIPKKTNFKVRFREKSNMRMTLFDYFNK